ncbi:MAG: LamG-like jellyroll fold domain-containing protein [Pirellulaceae bacterium]
MKYGKLWLGSGLGVLMAASGAFADYADEVLADNPVAYYRFEEPEGSDQILDSSGNDNHSYEVNFVDLEVEGIVGNGAEFFGDGSIALDYAGDPTGSDFTIETWLKASEIMDTDGDGFANGTQVYVAQKDGGGLGRSDMLITANNELGTFIGGGTSNSGILPENETWYHFVMTIDEDDLDPLRFYINGEESEFNPLPGGPNRVEFADGEWVLGSHKSQGSQFFTGILDEIAFYEYRLDDPNGDDDISDSRIMAHYLAATGGGGGGLVGDFDDDGLLTADDIDRLTVAVSDGLTDAIFDVNESGGVDADDRLYWVETLKNTYVGDSNLDGEFGTGDFVAVFTAGKFETGQNATWAEGDWNGDGQFSTSDFVMAFNFGGFEQGPKVGVSAVPEPNSFALLACGLLGVTGIVRRRR